VYVHVLLLVERNDAVSRKIFGKRECQRFHALLARGRKIAKVKLKCKVTGGRDRTGGARRGKRRGTDC
jgi:hypothetical protein